MDQKSVDEARAIAEMQISEALLQFRKATGQQPVGVQLGFEVDVAASPPDGWVWTFDGKVILHHNQDGA